MSELISTEHQLITQNGKPAFVVIPFEDYDRIQRLLTMSKTIPHEVVMAHTLNDISMIKAWRQYLGMTQKEVAEKAGMQQSALARLEKKGNPGTTTLKKIARAMNLDIAQIEE